MAHLSILVNLLIRSAFLGVLLMVGWNYGITAFFTQAPQVGLIESMLVLFVLQAHAVYIMRPIHTQMFPIYLPAESYTNKNEKPE